MDLNECFLVLLCLSTFLSLPLHGLRPHSPELPKDEDFALEARLRILNKHAVKTIKTRFGSVIDCVDIDKQPALDHPLLKDHKIQMDPSSEESSGGNFNFQGVCPNGTIPIRRTTKHDLLREKFLQRLESILSDTPSTTNNVSRFRAHIDMIRSDHYYEARANLNIWNPQLTGDQFSTSLIRFGSGDQFDGSPDGNGIYVGWAVYPILYGDDLPHLFTYWKGNGSSLCYDMRCPGFVQTDKGIVLGGVLPHISVYGGLQHQFVVHVVQDVKTKNWLLKYTADDRQAGYWPKELFPELVHGAKRLSFGGLTIHGSATPSPPMGSGYKPDGEVTHSHI